MATAPRSAVPSAAPFTSSPIEKNPEGPTSSPSIRTRFPESAAIRTRIRDQVELLHQPGLVGMSLSAEGLEARAVSLLENLRLSLEYTGWTMCEILNRCFREDFHSIPNQHRLLLLPVCSHSCTEMAESKDCELAKIRKTACSLGYKTATVANSSDVYSALMAHRTDAVIGVAALTVLERSIDKFNTLGIPSVAIPMRAEGCMADCLDVDAVYRALQIPFDGRPQTAHGYSSLMRVSANLFRTAELSAVMESLQIRGELFSQLSTLMKDWSPAPLTGTQDLAFDFLSKGGKYSRPFITLAAFHALSADRFTGLSESELFSAIPASVKRVAMSIEVFHKASLIHDDFEDSDDYRYGQPTMHRTYGAPVAINVGDYLIGLGYRLVSRELPVIGSEVVASILDLLANAHMRLAEGQGAELLWRNSDNRALTAEEALRIYELKTAPAFEAALFSGIHLAKGERARQVSPEKEPDWDRLFTVGLEFSRLLGSAFQILNDLKDWKEGEDNKMHAGGDVLGGRPTVLWAMALENLTGEDRTKLLELSKSAIESGSSKDDNPSLAQTISAVRALYLKADVFRQADNLVRGYRMAALDLIKDLDPLPLRALFQHLIKVVLAG